MRGARLSLPQRLIYPVHDQSASNYGNFLKQKLDSVPLELPWAAQGQPYAGSGESRGKSDGARSVRVADFLPKVGPAQFHQSRQLR